MQAAYIAASFADQCAIGRRSWQRYKPPACATGRFRTHRGQQTYAALSADTTLSRPRTMERRNPARVRPVWACRSPVRITHRTPALSRPPGTPPPTYAHDHAAAATKYLQYQPLLRGRCRHITRAVEKSPRALQLHRRIRARAEIERVRTTPAPT